MRFISESNKTEYGVVETLKDKSARLIEGSIFEEFSVTENRSIIKKILPPLVPPNIIGVGLNYAGHADETGTTYLDIPVMFLKGTNAVTGYGDPIVLPKAGPNAVDYEAELAIVIGKRAKNIPRELAFDYILGYCCANDVSARDWQKAKQKKQWSRGKSFDTFCPLGPWLVTKDDIPNPNDLSIRSEVNGEIMQQSNTGDMIFDVAMLISNLSQSLTLLPGTVILTGTPEGVGFTRQPPVFLVEGDEVTITIEKIGSLSNPVILESY
jgi:2-keto-4-pentenoate hydratase/2-oxohepta-3-ene-1,7-dioic acid hydratase in catechol pathway